MNKHTPKGALPGHLFLIRLWCTYGNVFTEILKQMIRHPLKTTQLFNRIIRRIYRRQMNPQKDKRFRHHTWQRPLFRLIKNSYLISCDEIEAYISSLEGLSPLTHRQARFCSRIILDMFAPSNFLLTNPEVQHLIVAKQGKNIIAGWRNFIRDLAIWQGYFCISRSKTDAFIMGETIAYTPSKIVFENELFQLLYYTSAEHKSDQAPLLIVSSWVNKYYLFDLRESNSFVKWATGQNLSVYMISWNDANENTIDKDFSDYVLDGMVTAIKQVKQHSNQSHVHGFGYCLGGTLLATTAAYLKAKGYDDLKSLSLLGTLLDFSDPGDLACFSGDAQLALFDQLMKEDGYWHGHNMATAFNLLRSRQLIWPYFIQHYLRGRTPRSLDSFFWGEDMTQIPSKLYRFHLKNLMRDNELARTNTLIINNTPIDLSTIRTPTYYAAMRNDDISPWQSCLESSQLLRCPVEFTTIDSDHISGVLKQSWWPRWLKWLSSST